ncbi:FAD-dependent oxidoreductase [Chloroflexota bacterium]
MSVEKQSPVNIKANVIIIGGGAAGLAAAVSAVEAGAKDVLVVEARRATGGNGVFPIGIFGAGSHLQRRLGFDAGTDNVFKSAMNYAHWRTNPRLVRALIEKSGDTILWLEGKGVKFETVIAHYPNQEHLLFHVTSPPTRTGVVIMKAMRKACTSLGVSTLCQAKATKILKDKKGNATGVLAKTPQGDINLRGKSIVIATGGFAGNQEMLNKYTDNYREEEITQVGLPHKGDGLKLAAAAGAAIENSVTLEMLGPAYPGPDTIAPVAGKPNTIWVNKHGERFADETISFLFSEGANAIYRQPGKVSYTLFDEEIKRNIVREGLSVIEGLFRGNKPWPGNLEKDLEAEADKGNVMTGSLDDIAGWMEVSPEVLHSTVDEYNGYCDRGYDEIFAKDRQYLKPLRTPPYYALRCGIGFVVTHGGIKTSHRMEVLDPLDRPIPGLYAAGVDTGGTDGETYNVGLSGHSFGFSVNSGRLAGESATAYQTSMGK